MSTIVKLNLSIEESESLDSFLNRVVDEISNKFFTRNTEFYVVLDLKGRKDVELIDIINRFLGSRSKFCTKIIVDVIFNSLNLKGLEYCMGLNRKSYLEVKEVTKKKAKYLDIKYKIWGANLDGYREIGRNIVKKVKEFDGEEIRINIDIYSENSENTEYLLILDELIENSPKGRIIKIKINKCKEYDDKIICDRLYTSRDLLRDYK